jgi:hypothetical protein
MKRLRRIFLLHLKQCLIVSLFRFLKNSAYYTIERFGITSLATSSFQFDRKRGSDISYWLLQNLVDVLIIYWYA